MKTNVETLDSTEMLNALKGIYLYRGIIPYQAYEYFEQHQAEASPKLLQILADTLARHERTGDYYVGHIHALLLLAQFKEKKAYPLIVQFLNLPIDSIDRLLGDILTETLPQILTSIYDGDPSPLFNILETPTYHESVRSMAGCCLAVLIYHELLQKELVIARIQSMVTSGKMNDDQIFFTALAHLVLEVKLEPLYDIVRAAFNANVVDTFIIGLEHFEADLPKSSKDLIRTSYLHPVKAADELKQWHSYSNERPISIKVERNAPCPCGEKRKFKHCCMNMV